MGYYFLDINGNKDQPWLLLSPSISSLFRLFDGLVLRLRDVRTVLKMMYESKGLRRDVNVLQMDANEKRFRWTLGLCLFIIALILFYFCFTVSLIANDNLRDEFGISVTLSDCSDFNFDIENAAMSCGIDIIIVACV